jgi:hypothetical protein
VDRADEIGGVGRQSTWHARRLFCCPGPNSESTQKLVDSSMVSILDELERLRLAKCRPHTGDRRKHSVHFTDHGIEILQQTAPP